MNRREEVIRIFAEIRAALREPSENVLSLVRLADKLGAGYDDAEDAERVARKIMALLQSQHEEIAIWGFPEDQNRLGGAFHALEVGAVIPTKGGFTAIYSCWPEDAEWACNFTKAEKQYILDRICTVVGAEAQLLNRLLVYPGFTNRHDGEEGGT